MKKESRPVRINRVAKKLSRRFEARQDPKRLRPLRLRQRAARAVRIVAYDLETTRIQANETPCPLYITAFSDEWKCSIRLHAVKDLRLVLLERFLIPEFNKTRFVAWNGNNFDVYLVALALINEPEFELRPYLTRSKNLRGLRVNARNAKDKKGRKLSWEFLDGISMTGLTGWRLSKFLETFAPEHGKLKGPDFETEMFDATNKDHVLYAERDSEGLYRGLMRAEEIVRETFEETLRPTVGNLGIRIFQASMPWDTTVWAPNFQVKEILRGQVMRGGYCFRQRKFHGPIWKYDLNQAYAAAMRKAKLPAGSCVHASGRLNPYASVFIVRMEAEKRGNIVPFYYRGMDGKSRFALDRIEETWLTSIEYNQLKNEGWRINVKESFFWQESFSMKSFVDRLENLRVNAPGGPSGAVGTMVKMIGNNSYGKTVEQLDGLELIMSAEQPEGFSRYQNEGVDLDFIWYRFGQPQAREYHQPQLGSFITADVRMDVRRAALLAPDAWLYADTDCVAFTRAVPLPLSPTEYGKWKLEEAGAEYYIIEKKVYARADGAVKHAKGMNVRRLSMEDMRNWFDGKSPVQTQTQRQNFVKFMQGGAMFAERRKVGQNFERVK